MSPLAGAPFLPVFAGWCLGISLSPRFNPLFRSRCGNTFSMTVIFICTGHYLQVPLIPVAFTFGCFSCITADSRLQEPMRINFRLREKEPSCERAWAESGP
jgi:hypothetical protein